MIKITVILPNKDSHKGMVDSSASIGKIKEDIVNDFNLIGDPSDYLISIIPSQEKKSFSGLKEGDTLIISRSGEIKGKSFKRIN